MRCDICGNNIDSDSEFCEYCGAGIESTSIDRHDMDQKDEVATSEKTRIDRSILVFAICALVIIAVGFLSQQSDGLVSYSEYMAIQTGMSYDEVCKIIGSNGRPLDVSETAGNTTAIVNWDGEGSNGASATVIFKNGKAVSKHQEGLN